MEKFWSLIITPKKNWLDLNLKHLIYHRDLLVLFVKRDIAVQYKQTILGPLWFFIQPILTTFMFVFVFGNIAKISTEGIPQPLFYMSGIVIWSFFSDCFNKTSDTFTQNAGLFGKVYYPRLITPLSIVVSNLVKFFLQFFLFLLILIYFGFKGVPVFINSSIIFFPLFISIMGLLGLGFGLIFSALTTKYKDLKFLIQFGIQLLMYATPIIYPLSSISVDKRIYVLLNPITSIVEGFKFIFLGEGFFNIYWIIYSFLFTIVILFVGIVIFNKTEQSFMDTV